MEFKPRTINSTSFLNIVLEMGLDALKQNVQDKNFMINYIYKNENNTELEVKQNLDSLEPKEQKEKINKKEKQEKAIPDNLLHLQNLIYNFWQVKKGSKSDNAWKMQISEINKFIKKYGESIVVEQLEMGILDGTWKGLKMANYEEQLKRKNKYNNKPDDIKHPAQQVTTFDDFGVINN
tara:strand:+ start:2719 stop:3255 length:537 start_codon:yes stop_codon:yes gene_type:complete